MSLPPSTANWHWKNKNVTKWGQEWFERELVTISVTGDKEGESVSITEVQDVEGDIELGQRKSKLITIYDCKLKLRWQGTTSDGTEVSGSLTIPEVSHEVTVDKLSDYTYNWSLSTASSPEVTAIFKLARTRLPALLEAKFAEFPNALVDTHGKDLTVSTDPSRSGTPAPAHGATPAAPAAAPRVAAAAPPPPKKAEKPLNTIVVKVEATFQASGPDLYQLLTDETRIPSWTRAPAMSRALPGTEYALFGGGVRGQYVSLTPYTEIVQTWALSGPTWPSGHFATMTTTVDQGTDSTKITFTLSDAPVGMHDELKRNIEGY
ncbi:hypothetical protein BDN72DRAFT_775985 [Pluteus cervinus]|uniref:Uncharacterized protein n=1 Tax=Pluteus cervinus TaxID=181527 RepID=A0ACD3AD38_9AGAR|nr:hypothetical protein BDN72DRAFT_775985 [Pluteus cervinus]